MTYIPGLRSVEQTEGETLNTFWGITLTQNTFVKEHKTFR